MFLQIQIHLIGWIEKVDEAINDAEEPPEKRSMLWWGISLAGNLIWAATSLNGIGQTAKVAMSFVGAAIGTGVAEKARDAFSTEKGRKDVLKKRIAALQGVFEQGFHDKRFDWAGEFDSKRVIGRGYDEELSMFVWGKMFAIPYKSDEGRYHQVYVNSKANIEKLLARFRDEWTRWNDGNKLINLSDGLGHLHIKPPTYKKNFDPDLEPVWKEMEMTFDMNRPLV